MRQSISKETDDGCFHVRLNELSASQNFRHFMNRLNRAAFGKAAQRYGKGLAVVPILEGGSNRVTHLIKQKLRDRLAMLWLWFHADPGL